MAKEPKACCVLELKLNTNKADEHELNERFFRCFLAYNQLVKHARACLSALRSDIEYRQLLGELYELKKLELTDEVESEINIVYKKLNTLRERYGLSEYQFHAWIAEQKNKRNSTKNNHKRFGINVAQKLATRVWKSVESVMYKKGKTIHFKQFDHFKTLEGKRPDDEIRIVNGRLCWFGLSIGIQYDKKDAYEQEMLTHKLKYLRIKRIPLGSRYHYYVQLVLEGVPPLKINYKTDGGTVGIDPGVSTEAVVSDSGCILEELSVDVNRDKEFRRLQRQQERSRRATNPDNYNPDGTLKKKRHRFVKSKSYKKRQRRIQTMYRKNKEMLKQKQRVLCKKILENHGTRIIAEKMNYKALQKRSKDTKINPKTGKCYSKKRFGKSLAKNAPARFLTLLDEKLSYIGEMIEYINTQKYRASQYDHTSGEYNKKELNDRICILGDNTIVQRDLYSAFLIKNIQTEENPDRTLCIETFQLFLTNMRQCMKELTEQKKQGKIFPSCMGIQEWERIALTQQ